jgi:hypothetical protein
MMPRMISGLGIAASLVIMVISAAMNARYAMSWGATGVDRALLAGVAVFADVGNALAWIYVVGAWARGAVVTATVSFVIFIACLVMAVSGSLGFISAQRSTAAVVVAAHLETEANWRAQKERIAERRRMIGTVDSEPVTAKRIAAQQQNAHYTRSKGCSDATTGDSRKFCSELAELEARRELAKEAARLDNEITIVAAQIAHVASGLNSREDAQATLIATVTGWPLERVQLWLQLLVVLVVEAGACFMLQVSADHGRGAVPADASELCLTPILDRGTASAPSPQGDVATSSDHGNDTARPVATLRDKRPLVARARDRKPADTAHIFEFLKSDLTLTAVRRDRVALADVVKHYQQWCVAQQLPALDDAPLTAVLDTIAHEMPIERQKRGEDVFWLGVRLLTPTRKAQKVTQ